MTTCGEKMLTRGHRSAIKTTTTTTATMINNSRNVRANTNIKPPTASASASVSVRVIPTATESSTTTRTTRTTVGLNGNNRRSTTITSDPGILCFHHCNVKVFCFVLPHICPNCKSELHAHGDTITSAQQGIQTTNGIADNGVTSVTYGEGNAGDNAGQRISTMMCMSTKLLPFRLPYPFVRASQSPCAIVLRPTTGDFLK